MNQALSASENNPIRGETSNTLANIPPRVPIPEIPPDSLQEIESEGNSWYNGLEVSLTKRLSHGLQFLASYSFSKVLDTDGADINSTSSGNALTLGDQNSPRQRWGRGSLTARTDSFSAPLGSCPIRQVDYREKLREGGVCLRWRRFSLAVHSPFQTQTPPMFLELAKIEHN